ncbi:AAA family ATPase [Fontimonas sp. SYSU GA230001]|uniref:ParA family protein n=1 Tax=Fontimonas sp. SYSU GA230001 TaxID=3142450 RepID=UPI0032B53672
MKTVALHNLKGGVGKTAAAVNLAYLAAANDVPTLLWDLDPQGASSWYFHGQPQHEKTKNVLHGATPVSRLVTPSPYANLSLIPADFSYRYLDVMLRKVEPPRQALRRLLKPFAGDYALAILDCPPSLSHLADNVFAAADLVLAPVVPTWLSLRALEQVEDYLRDAGFDPSRLRPFYSMADRRRQLHRELIERRPQAMARGLHAVIPYASMVERMGERRAPMAAFAPSDDPALLAYAELWLELKAMLKL